MASIELTSIAPGFNSDIKGINMKEKSTRYTTPFSSPSYCCICKKQLIINQTGADETRYRIEDCTALCERMCCPVQEALLNKILMGL